MIETITNKVRITVKSNYIPERSDPSKPIYFFAYHINIQLIIQIARIPL